MENRAIYNNTTGLVLLYIVKGNHVALGLRRKTPWKDRYSGSGGNKEACDKNLEETFVRETLGEWGVTIDPDDMTKMAELKIFRPGKQMILLHVCTIAQYEGELRSSDEMRAPSWFPIENLPIEHMIPGDEHWVYRMLKGEFLKGEIYRSLDLETLIDINIYEADPKSFMSLK